MADLSLNLINGTQNYRDLLVVDNDLVITSDVDSSGTNPVLQDILQRLGFFAGEWFLDNTQGLPWFQEILIKNPNQANIDAILRNVILGTSGVKQLTAYNSSINLLTRVLTVSFTATTTSGVVSYNGNVAPITGGQT